MNWALPDLTRINTLAAGANAATVEVAEIDEVPLTYLPSNAVLIRAKAAEDLAVG